MKKKFMTLSSSSFFAGLLFLLFGACSQNKKLVKKDVAENSKNLFFLEYFNSDRIRIYGNKTKILDTIVSSNRTIGVSFIKKINYPKITVKFNNDTSFLIEDEQKKQNDFLFKKEGQVYFLIKSKDTTIVSF